MRLKLREASGERRVRVVDDDGAADLFGAAADEVFAGAAPLVAWLRDQEPGVPVRALILDEETCRVQVSIDERIAVPGPDGAPPAERLRPRMFRADGPLAEELLGRAEAAFAAAKLGVVAARARRR